ncbi:taste receptor type 2 member 45-like [Saccopteryx bilineata]|uniref:taste receptor type 2 member 45-like n=1 Tax=Saccopteryx bilineata TaxID=59482 RepID=UPI00338D56B3
MVSLSINIFSILVITEFVLGNFANGFIVLVNCMDWFKRQMSCADRILTALAVSRIGLLWLILLNWCASLLNPALFSSKVKTIVYIFWALSSHFSLWLVTSLSILYLLRIANFSSPFFLHLKWKAERVVLMILLGSCIFLACHVAVICTDDNIQMNEYEGNTTWETNLRATVKVPTMTTYTLANFIPFTISMSAFLMLIFSLWKHLKKMQLGGKTFEDASTKVHVRAMQTVLSFLLLFVIHVVAQIISIWTPKTIQNDSFLMLCQVLGLLYPFSHSFILIWGNKKLQQAFLSFLWQLRCW